MTLFTNILAGLLLLVTGFSVAQTPASEVAGKSVSTVSQAAREAEWFSYRDAYRAMLPFEKYGKAKNLLQNHYQISSRDKSGVTDPVGLILQSKSIRLNLSLDATGRTVLPLLKQAYDENAELVLTQKMNQKVNQFLFRSRISIMIRNDGIYEAADLREACEQAFAYQNYLDAGVLRGKKCVGVRFVYLKNSLETVVEFRHGAGSAQALPVQDSAAFWGESNENFRTMTYLFSSWPEKGQVVTRSAPIVISAQFD